MARDGDLRAARARASRSCTPACARICAAPTRASPRTRRSPTSKRSASRPSSCCRCTTSSTSSFLHERGLTNYWGYSSIGVPRAARRLRRHGHPGRADQGVQGDGQGAPPRRHRGDPRRRLQPHGRGQPPRPDALVQGHRQRLVLPPDAGRPEPLHGLHGHRQQPQPRASERAAADHGLAALLGHGVPRRRLPLRSRLGARARALRRRPPLGVLRRHPPGPGALAGEADRRALGSRPRRLPGRQLPGAVDGVERHLPRHDARLLARPGQRRRRSPRASPARATSTSPTAATPPPRSTSSPRTTASRSPTSSRTTRSTTRRTARRTGTARTTTAPGTAASRGPRTIPTSPRCASASSATSSPRCCSRRACR